jgi:mRNA deadenylase 3'-5' endonuclease subunit Ccr4
MYAAIGREPENTNYTPGFTGTLDYMFLLDGSSVKPTSLRDYVDVEGGLPIQDQDQYRLLPYKNMKRDLDHVVPYIVKRKILTFLSFVVECSVTVL